MARSDGEPADLGAGGTVREQLAREHVTITIVVPAYNEGAGITATLDSLSDGMGALGILETPLFLSDSSSDLATARAAQEWADRTGASFVVEHSDQRHSLKAALNVALASCASDLVVVTVADVIVPVRSLAALLAALLAAPRPDVVVGVACPDPTATGLRYAAGRFQLRAVAAEIRFRPAAMRAEGALWGAWRQFYEGHRYLEGAGSVADDVELAKAVAARGARGTTAQDALVHKIPPGTLRDFCLQTRRSFYAISTAPGSSRDWCAYRAFIRTALADPVGPVLYVGYRCYAACFRSRFVAAAHSETWEPSPSTKRTGS